MPAGKDLQSRERGLVPPGAGIRHSVSVISLSGQSSVWPLERGQASGFGVQISSVGVIVLRLGVLKAQHVFPCYVFWVVGVQISGFVY